MPHRQPFTRLCQQAAQLSRSTVADLHVHTTASDGDNTPSQVVAMARAAGVDILAITDHDTTAALFEAQATAATFTYRPIHIVPGVEISSCLDGREYHVLGYFITVGNGPLAASLEHVQVQRRKRFRQFIDRLTDRGVTFPAGMVEGVEAATTSPGRRHLAKLLVSAGTVATHGDAFRDYITQIEVPADHCMPLTEAVALITEAGGIASLAHPRPEMTRDELAVLRRLGLHAVEAHFGNTPYERTRELRRWAGELDMLVTGGSDFHGTYGGIRQIGTPGLPIADFDALYKFAGSQGYAKNAKFGSQCYRSD
jgi:predicted metal-dependent phosphoesterase TrpH